MNTRTRTPAAQNTGAAAGTDKTISAGDELARELGVETATQAAANAEASEAAARQAAARGPDIHIRTHKADIDTGEQDLSIHDRSIDLNNDFDIFALRDALNAGGQDLGNPLMSGFVETLAFMEEMVLIRVHPSSEKDSEKIIEVWNDGTPQRFIRDQWVVSKRKYVEVLARSMPYSVTTPEGLDGRGDKTRRIETHTGNRFPFEMKDRNPIGATWLNRLFMERG